MLHSGKLWPYLQTLDQAGKACQGQTHQLIKRIRKLRTKKFYNIGPRRGREGRPDFQQNDTKSGDTRGQSYKTFYGRNLRIFVISQCVCPWKGLPKTKTQAYYENPYITAVKSFIGLAPVAKVIKLFLSVIYEFSY